MQKKIIALAIAGLASTAAFAQTNVTVYGVVDMGFQHTSSSDTNTLKSRSGIDNGMLNRSRVGFRGVEDLGNGLKVSFVLEQGVDADRQNAAGIWNGTNRQSLLALSGSFGTVALGRQYTPQYGLVSSMDPFGTGTVGDVTMGRGVYYMGAAAAPTTIRLDNLAAYVSPTFGGFNVIAGYTANGLADETSVFTTSGAANANAAYNAANAAAIGAGILTANPFNNQDGNAKVWAINPNYANGPIKAGLNYHQVKIDALNYKDKVWDLGGSYDFGVAKLAGLYGQLNNSIGAVDTKAKQYMVGLTVPVGSAGAVLASYSRNKTDFEGAPDAKASKYAIGYTHNLSKRTTAYAAYAKISTNNVAEGAFSVRSAGDDDYTSGLNIGLRHNF